jgi:hypothetical protein
MFFTKKIWRKQSIQSLPLIIADKLFLEDRSSNDMPTQSIQGTKASGYG